MTIDGGLWVNHVKPKLSPYGLFRRIEDGLGQRGWPDVYYTIRGVGPYRPVSGWLELKQTEKPDRATTPMFIKSLKREQVDWHADEHAAGGRVHTLIKMSPFFILVDAPVLRAIYDRKLLLPEVRAQSRYYSDRFNPSEIVRCLRAALTITRT